MQIFVSTWKTKTKLTATIRTLRYHYEIFTISLCSLGPARRKGKLKDQIAWIEEIDSEPYETVIPGIEMLHFTSPEAPLSIRDLGMNQFRPMGS